MTIVISIVVLILFIILLKNILTIKVIKWSSVNMINGAVKTGKSTLAIWATVFDYKLTYWSVKIENGIIWIINHILFFKKKKIKYKEIPLLYSNIPIKIRQGYSPLTKEILTRKERPRMKSRIYIGEMSLVANSMDFKDMLLNEEIMLFLKLSGHEFNGRIYIDTQSINDNHFAVKRCINQYIYIHSMKKIPFFCVLKVREMTYSEDNQSAINVFNEDIENTMKTLVIPKGIWNCFDYRCYSILTDNLPIAENVIKRKDVKTLKTKYIVSFRDFLTIDNKFTKGVEKNETNIQSKKPK